MRRCMSSTSQNNSERNFGLVTITQPLILTCLNLKMFDQVFLFFNKVFTAAAMLGVAYPPDL